MKPYYFYVMFVSVLCNFQPGDSLPSPALDVSVAAAAGFHPTSNSIETKQDFMESVYFDCTDTKNSVPCFKRKLFAFVDRIINKDEISLANGISVVRTSAAVDGAPRSLVGKAGESEIENTDTASMLISRVQKFLTTHTLKVDLNGSDVLNAVTRAGRTLDDVAEEYEESGEVEESRKKKGGGGKKKDKMMGHMMMMLKMKLLGLIPLVFGAIALMAGKALLFGKIALILSLIVLLKKLLSQHQKTVTYEIVGGHPHSAGGHDSYSAGSSADYSTYQSGGGGAGASGGGHSSGWGRSADAHSMAYSAYQGAEHTKSD